MLGSDKGLIVKGDNKCGGLLRNVNTILRNSCKNTVFIWEVSQLSWAGSHLTVFRILPGWDENFPYEYAREGQSSKVERIILRCISFVVLSKFNLKMTSTSTTMITAKKLTVTVLRMDSQSALISLIVGTTFSDSLNI